MTAHVWVVEEHSRPFDEWLVNETFSDEQEAREYLVMCMATEETPFRLSKYVRVEEPTNGNP